MRTPSFLAAAAALLATALSGAPAHAGKTLDAVKARGTVKCGVTNGVAGFSAPDTQGNWSGLDVDTCRAIAAAVLGDPKKAEFVPLNSQQRFAALQAGEVDILTRNTTWNLTRDASLGLHFTTINYYDGQGFLVPVASKIRAASQLRQRSICVTTTGSSEKTLKEYSAANRMELKVLSFPRFRAAMDAYLAGRCEAISADATSLAVIRRTQTPLPAEHTILPALISKEPLGPMVRSGDEGWARIVTWVVYGLIAAEEHGITRANVDQQAASSRDAEVQRMLGRSEDMGKLIGLDREWLLRAIRATGNYGEIFARNVGPNSALGLPRGLNALWRNGGLMYALPIR